MWGCWSFFVPAEFRPEICRIMTPMTVIWETTQISAKKDHAVQLVNSNSTSYSLVNPLCSKISFSKTKAFKDQMKAHKAKASMSPPNTLTILTGFGSAISLNQQCDTLRASLCWSRCEDLSSIKPSNKSSIRKVFFKRKLRKCVNEPSSVGKTWI